MNRLISPLIKISITLLILVLLILIIILFFTPSHRISEKNRRTAVKTLTGTDGSLNSITASVANPYLENGSLSNLVHYLSRDSMRIKFRKRTDQRRYEAYSKLLSTEIEHYSNDYADIGMEWIPEFLATTRALFEEVKQDVTEIAFGTDTQHDNIQNNSSGVKSAAEMMEMAINQFSQVWIPYGETHLSYKTDKQKIHSHLKKNRQFNRAMKRLDAAWRTNISILYNLTLNENWNFAVRYDPSLANELDTLTVSALAGDLYRRSMDIMKSVQDASSSSNRLNDYSLRWTPDLSFFKNIPELTGQVQDDQPTFFFFKVNIGYTFQDTLTQTWLNQHKDWLSDHFRAYISNMNSDDLYIVDSDNSMEADWVLALLKADIIHTVNKKIVLDHRFNERNAFGIRELSFVRIHLIPDL